MMKLLLIPHVFSAALRVPLATKESEAASPNAQVFVVNLDARKDRCKCASHELRNSIYPVTRFAAADSHTYKERCPRMSTHAVIKKNSHPGAYGLVCTNYNIWESMHSNPEAPEFGIIFEDDILIEEGFWNVVDHSLKQISAEGWDIVYVDPKTGPKNEGIKQVTGGVAGSHMMIVRRTSASKLIAVAEKVYASMDRFSALLARENVKVGVWTPGIIKQYSARTGHHGLANADKMYCSTSSAKSDLKTLSKEDDEKMAFEC